MFAIDECIFIGYCVATMTFRVKTLSPNDAPPFQAFTFPLFHSLFAWLEAGESSPLIAAGAQMLDEPAGLALFQRDASGSSAELLSVFTAPAFRRQGIASAMIRHGEAVLAQRGVKRIKAVYEQGRPHSESVHRLLAELRYPEPTVRAYVGRVQGHKLAQAAWLKPPRLPQCFEIFLWRDLKPEERRRIQESQARSPWYPEQLDPFRFEPVEPLNSVGLRFENEVAGWQINHRIASDTIRYTALFVRQDLQSTGVAAALLRASSLLHLNCGDAHIDKATFAVPVQQEGMVKFVRKRMEAFVNQLNESVETTKELT